MKRLVSEYCFLFISYFCGLILISVWDAVATAPASPAIRSMIASTLCIVPPLLFVLGIMLCFVISTVQRKIILTCVVIMGLWSLLLLYGWMMSQGLTRS